MIEVSHKSKGDHKYEVSGTYVHQDLIPYILSWISAEFAIKVSKIINCYFSRETNNKIDKLQKTLDDSEKRRELDIKRLEEKLDKSQEKYDKDTEELKDNNKKLIIKLDKSQEKYDKDTEELKSKLDKSEKKRDKFERKYDRDTQELKDKIDELESRLMHKVINPNNLDKLTYLVIMRHKELEFRNHFRGIRAQKKRAESEMEKYLDEYEVFYCNYEPNSVACFNALKERLCAKGYIRIKNNTFELIKPKEYSAEDFLNDLQNLDLTRKYE
jgi:DNA repair exonuclease SbcCD ATPase subunit